MERIWQSSGYRDYDWECAVDNGVYYVEITAGDPDGDSSDPNIYSSCRYILKAEGEEVLDGVPTSSKRWISGSATVTVTDGRLTISGDSGASHNCISYVKFLKAPIGEMPSSVDLKFSYDDDPVTGNPGRGNLLADAHFEYVWDASDRIVEITDKSWKTGDNGPQKVSYVYDAMGRRVLTRWHYESSTTQYAMVYDGVAPIEQGEISKGVAQRFYYEGEINKPALVEQFDATTGALTGAYVPLTDDRGTVVGVYDVKVGNSTYGQLVEKLHYNATGLCKSFDPNGVENLTPGTDINLGRSFYDIPFGWCGMARDAFTGLYHTHFRDYDPVHGRWLSEDPAGYQDGLNLYAAYMGVNGVDKLGLHLPSTFPAWHPDTAVMDSKIKAEANRAMVAAALTVPAAVVDRVSGGRTNLTNFDETLDAKAAAFIYLYESNGQKLDGAGFAYEYYGSMFFETTGLISIAEGRAQDQMVFDGQQYVGYEKLGYWESQGRIGLGYLGGLGWYCGAKAPVSGVKLCRPKKVYSTFQEFSKATKGQFTSKGHQAARAKAWKKYKKMNGLQKKPIIKPTVPIGTQNHHLITEKMVKALEKNGFKGARALRNRKNLQYSSSPSSHNGYETWHRQMDNDMLGYIRRSKNLNEEQLLKHIHNYYQSPDIAKRIPGVNLVNRR